jgi:hypothetical protein
MRWDFCQTGQGALVLYASAAEHPLGDPDVNARTGSAADLLSDKAPLASVSLAFL